MADTATVDTSKTADPGTTVDTTATKAPPAVAPAAGQTQASTVTPKADLGPSLTMDQFKAMLAEERAKWDADRAKWEAEIVPQIREQVTAPIRRDAKIKSLREELRAGGRYLPADDDNSDPTSPGDLAALIDLDDTAIVAKDKAGNGLTRLDVELNRTRARLTKRAAKKADGDQLGTPPLEVAPDEYDRIRKETAAKEQAARDARKNGLARVFNTTGTR
jgi:hypothetical protein